MGKKGIKKQEKWKRKMPLPSRKIWRELEGMSKTKQKEMGDKNAPKEEKRKESKKHLEQIGEKERRGGIMRKK